METVAMSRRRLTAKEPNHEVFVGWNPALRTYFVQVFRRDHPFLEGEVVLREGTSPGEIDSIHALSEAVNYYAVVDDETKALLRKDRKEAMGVKVARGSKGTFVEYAPPEDRIRYGVDDTLEPLERLVESFDSMSKDVEEIMGAIDQLRLEFGALRESLAGLAGIDAMLLQKLVRELLRRGM
jgi:hypothetical protein